MLGYGRRIYKLGEGVELGQSLGRRSNRERQLGILKLFQQKGANDNKGSRELSGNDQHTRGGEFWGWFFTCHYCKGFPTAVNRGHLHFHWS